MSSIRVDRQNGEANRTRGTALAAPRSRGMLVLAGLIAGAALLCLAQSAHATVYEWKDARNETHYTDKPPPPDGVLISIKRTTPTNTPTRSGGEESKRDAAPAAAAPGGKGGAQPADLRKAVNADVSAAQEAQCKEAKTRYDQYVKSRRLYKEGPNKERVYLSDQELEEARVNARRAVDEACGSGSGE